MVACGSCTEWHERGTHSPWTKNVGVKRCARIAFFHRDDCFFRPRGMTGSSFRSDTVIESAPLSPLAEGMPVWRLGTANKTG